MVRCCGQNRWDIQAVLGEVFVGEHADAGKVVQDGLQVEGRLVAAGEILYIGVGESVCGGMQIDDVADHEPVMPGPGQADRGVQRHSAHARPRRQLDRYPAWPQRFLEQVYLQFVTGTRKPQHEARVAACGLHHPRPVTR